MTFHPASTMRIFTLLLIAIPCLSSCIAVAGVGAGALVATEILSDTPHVAHIPVDVDRIWPDTVENLTQMGATEMQIQNYPRVIQAKVYEGEIYVKVEAYDIDHSILRLQFRKNGFINNSTAESIMAELLNRYDFNGS